MSDRPFVDFPAEESAIVSAHPGHGVRVTLPPGTIIFAPEDVLSAVAPRFGLAVADLKGPRRTRNVSEARDAAYWLLRRHTRMGYERMAECMGRADHSGVIHAVRRATQRRETDAWFGDILDQLERDLEAKAKGTVAA